jgi:vesicle-fusing ATPase
MADNALMIPGTEIDNEKRRVEILSTLMTKMKITGTDEVITELARVTNNFTASELESLFRAAASKSYNRTVEINPKTNKDEPDAFQKLIVRRDDFLDALMYDVKSAFEAFLPRGIHIWGGPVQDVIDDCSLLIRNSLSSDGPCLVSILLEGADKCGKTALAAHLVINSGFPVVKICDPADMVRLSI